MNFARITLLSAFLAAIVGCSSSPSSNLLVKSRQSDQPYRPEFSEAYASRTVDGAVDVVLTGESQCKTSSATVKQILHVRVLWRPMVGTKTDNPTAVNATFNWLVFASDAKNSTDCLEYTGAGFVTLDRKGDVSYLTIRNATLNPTKESTTLTDPIGVSKLDGVIVAKNDSDHVKQLLEQAKTTTATARQAKGERPVSSTR